MDFVDEYERAAILVLEALARGVQGDPYILDPARDGAQRHEVLLDRPGEHPRERRLARARRPPENEATDPVAFHRYL